jgi:hypothetical protein
MHFLPRSQRASICRRVGHGPREATSFFAWRGGGSLGSARRSGRDGTPHVSASKQVKLQFFTLSPADKNCRGTAQARMTHSAVIGRLALGCEWTLLRAGQVVRGACNSMTLRRRAFFSRFYNSWVRRSPTQESNAR